MRKIRVTVFPLSFKFESFVIQIRIISSKDINFLYICEVYCSTEL